MYVATIILANPKTLHKQANGKYTLVSHIFFLGRVQWTNCGVDVSVIFTFSIMRKIGLVRALITLLMKAKLKELKNSKCFSNFIIEFR